MKCLSLKTALSAVAMLATIVASARAASPESVEQQLKQAASDNKYAFIVFYKQNDAATQAVAKTVSQSLAGRSDEAVLIYASISDPANKAIVEQYQTARAPMPMTLAVAPNGAVTGAFSQKLTSQNVTEAFVTPTTATCMKSLQQGKIVLLSIHPAGATQTPSGVQSFHTDTEFKGRVSLVSMRLDDKAEAAFLSELAIDPATTRTTQVVFMAPPGVMVGKYTAQVTKEKLAADLHAAGKCCNDPNCKHGKAK